jgi:hypothetical protein
MEGFQALNKAARKHEPTEEELGGKGIEWRQGKQIDCKENKWLLMLSKLNKEENLTETGKWRRWKKREWPPGCPAVPFTLLQYPLYTGDIAGKEKELTTEPERRRTSWKGWRIAEMVEKRMAPLG